MSIVYIDQEAVHYEVFGRGRPILFLHGWLGSWRYWLPSMEVASQRFRTYSFDFVGFGDTLPRNVTPSINAYSDQVIRFLDAMGMSKVTLVGHSMGGMVSLKTAIDHPERIERVVTVGAPIVGSSLSTLLKLTASQRIADLMARVPNITKLLFRYFLGETRQEHMAEILEDCIKPSSSSVRAAVRSMLRTDLRPELARLRVPSLVIHGTRDDIVHPNQIDVIQAAAVHQPYLRAVAMQGCRHFPWVDGTDEFHEHMMEFLKAPLREITPEVVAVAPFVAPPSEVAPALASLGPAQADPSGLAVFPRRAKVYELPLVELPSMLVATKRAKIYPLVVAEQPMVPPMLVATKRAKIYPLVVAKQPMVPQIVEQGTDAELVASLAVMNDAELVASLNSLALDDDISMDLMPLIVAASRREPHDEGDRQIIRLGPKLVAV